MSGRVGNLIIIAPEPPDFCEECGEFEETRPYGTGGKRICFRCGEKNPEETQRQMNIRLFGDREETQH